MATDIEIQDLSLTGEMETYERYDGTISYDGSKTYGPTVTQL
jgi:hypothetical protein